MGREKEQVESHKYFLCLDWDPDLLYSLLEKSQNFLTKGKAKELLNYTINLDSNLKQTIAAKRAYIDRLHTDVDGASGSSRPEQNYGQSFLKDEEANVPIPSTASEEKELVSYPNDLDGNQKQSTVREEVLDAPAKFNLEKARQNPHATNQLQYPTDQPKKTGAEFLKELSASEK